MIIETTRRIKKIDKENNQNISKKLNCVEMKKHHGSADLYTI